MTETTVHVRITGLVQGVGYRAWCHRKARELNLSGFVRNRRTGEVEAVFSGPTSQVEAMVIACREGPHGARVDDVAVHGTGGPMTGPFEIAETA